MRGSLYCRGCLFFGDFQSRTIQKGNKNARKLQKYCKYNRLSSTFRMLSDFQRLATINFQRLSGTLATLETFVDFPWIAGAAPAGKDQRKNGRKTVK
jgi:hypothetical protein